MFPSFRAWVMALKLAIPAYAGATLVMGFEFWRFLVVGILLAPTAWEPAAFILLMSVALVAGGFLWFLLIAGVYSFLLKLLWTNPPKWLAAPTFHRLALRDFPILLVAVLPLSSLSLTLTAFSVLKGLPLDVSYVDAYVEEMTTFVIRFCYVWLVAAAYLYHIYLGWKLKKS